MRPRHLVPVLLAAAVAAPAANAAPAEVPADLSVKLAHSCTVMAKDGVTPMCVKEAGSRIVRVLHARAVTERRWVATTAQRAALVGKSASAAKRARKVTVVELHGSLRVATTTYTGARLVFDSQLRTVLLVGLEVDTAHPLTPTLAAMGTPATF